MVQLHATAHQNKELLGRLIRGENDIALFKRGAKFVPQLDLFNIGNAGTIVRYNVAVGSTYLTPAEILAPRIIRVGFSFDF